MSAGENVKSKRLRRRKPGDLGQLRRVLWETLLEAESLARTGTPHERLRAMHALGTLAGSYLKALEAHELEKRVKELEERVAELTQGRLKARRTA